MFNNNLINASETVVLVKQEKFAGLEVDFYRNESNEVFMTRNQIGMALGYGDPTRAMSKLHERNKSRLDDFSTVVKLTTTDGKSYDTHLYSEKGIYEIMRKSNQPKADEFYDFVYDIIEGLRKGELQLNRASYQIDDPIERAKQWIKEEEERQQLGKQVLELSAKVETYEPKAEYLDTILSSKSTVNATQIAKDYGLSAQALNRILSDAGIQYNTGGQWVLYSKHTGKGYTQSRTFERSGNTHMQTRWTQKGRLLIHDTLKQLGIIANMDKEETL